MDGKEIMKKGFPNEPEVIHSVVDSKFYEVILTSYNFQQKHYAEVRDGIGRAAQAGIGIIGMKAIRGGYRQTPRVENSAAALKWVLQDSNVNTIVPGFISLEEMNIDVAVMEDLDLTDEEKNKLQKQAFLPSLYCQGCRQCLGECPENLPIPDLMRACMYTCGYRNLALAQDLILSLNVPERICGNCPLCPVKCQNGWDVGNRIRDIVRLREVPLEFLV
jgi:predicted aldo/keto reductase-like oxidoreductase